LSARTRELSRLQFEQRQLDLVDSYLSLDVVALNMERSERLMINTLIEDMESDARKSAKLGVFTKLANIDDDVNESPNSTSKSDTNLLKAARDIAAALGDDRMLKLANSGI
jgi:hypothetical protein